MDIADCRGLAIFACLSHIRRLQRSLSPLEISNRKELGSVRGRLQFKLFDSLFSHFIKNEQSKKKRHTSKRNRQPNLIYNRTFDMWECASSNINSIDDDIESSKHCQSIVECPLNYLIDRELNDAHSMTIWYAWMSALHRKLTTVAINVQQTKENCLPLFPYIVYATDFFFFNLFGMDFSSHSIFNDPNSVCHLKNERVCRIKLREKKSIPIPLAIRLFLLAIRLLHTKHTT